MAFPARVVPLEAGSGAVGGRRLSPDRPEDVAKIEWLDRAFGGRLSEGECVTTVNECPALRRVIVVSACGVEGRAGRGGVQRVVAIHPFFWKIPQDIRHEVIKHEVRAFEVGPQDEEGIRRRTLRYLKDHPEWAMRHLCWFAANRYGIRLEGGFRRWIEEGIKDYFVLECWREFLSPEIEIASGEMFEALARLPDLKDRWNARARLPIKRAFSVILFDGTVRKRKINKI